MSEKKERVEHWLKEINLRWGNPVLQLDDNGHCHLKLKYKPFSFMLNDSHNTVVFWAPVRDAAPFLDNPQALAGLLKLNHSSEFLNGATLCIDPAEDFVMLKYQHHIDALDATTLEIIILNFSQMIDRTGTELEQLHRLRAATNDVPPLNSLSMIRP